MIELQKLNNEIAVKQLAATESQSDLIQQLIPILVAYSSRVESTFQDLESTFQEPVAEVVEEKVIVEEVQVVPKKKDEMIREWFEVHPKDLKKTGRELESNLLNGVKISHKTWNDIKKKVANK